MDSRALACPSTTLSVEDPPAAGAGRKPDMRNARSRRLSSFREDRPARPAHCPKPPAHLAPDRHGPGVTPGAGALLPRRTLPGPLATTISHGP